MPPPFSQDTRKEGGTMLLVFFAAVIVLADQLFKSWIAANITLGGTMAFIPDLLQLTHVHNYAAAFSMFKGMRIPIIIVTCIVCVAIIVALIMRKPRSVWQRVALMLVLGGAVGNLIDRIALGYVVDMFHTLFMTFPVFNIADIAIVVGGILFCVCILFEDTGRKLPKAVPMPEEETEEIYEKLREFAPVEDNDEPSDKSDE